MFQSGMSLLSVIGYVQITFEQVERFAFYERAKKAFAIVHTGYVSLSILCFTGHFS